MSKKMKFPWVVCRRNRRRTLITLIVLFIVVVVMSLMYLSHEVDQITLTKDEFLGRNEVSVLNQRLQQLEQQIRENKQRLNKLSESARLPDSQIAAASSFNPLKNGLKWLSTNATDFVLVCPAYSLPLQSKTHLSIPEMYSDVDFSNEDGGVWKQGWPLTYDTSQWNSNNKLHIFVVPHSHNDPGWLKTFENYYIDQTKHIFNNMVQKLKEDSKRKMIWAEVSYLSFWWERASLDERREMFRLVHSGQLEIVTGGWVMNDEAVTHYFAIMEQLMEGHEWLENHLKVYPENGWAIDPFGLSPTMAYVLKRMGMNHMVIQRVHYSVKKYLAKLKSVEFIWRQSWDQANVTDIFCHMMPFYSYDVPHTCGPDPKICCQFDFKRLPGGKINCPWKIPPQPISPANVAERAATLLDQYRKKAQIFRSNVLLVPLGDDFRFDKTAEWDQQYLNYQALFDYMNSKQDWNVKAQFGTLHDYFSAVDDLWLKEVPEAEKKPEVPSLSGDFFTYADRDDHYWSGYFSSRPLYKNMDRALEAYLRASEIIFSSLLAHLSHLNIEARFSVESLLDHLVTARRNVALFQHHDAIAGTGKDQVVIDYGKRLLSSAQGLQTVIARSAALLLSSRGEELASSSITFDLDDNRASHSSIPQKTLVEVGAEDRVVAFYNSLGRSRKEMVGLLVSSAEICVVNPDGEVVPAQLSPVWHGTELVDDKFELYFIVEVPALGLAKYILKLATKGDFGCADKSGVTIFNSPKLPVSSTWKLKVGEASEFQLENSLVRASFSSDGLLKSITNLYDNHTEPSTFSFLMYGTTTKKDKSGAYLFLPDKEAAPIEFDTPQYIITTGPIFSQVRTFLPFVEHTVQLRHSDELGAVHVSNLVDIMKELNKEIVMRVKTGISNSRTFYTDNNGFQMARRIILDKLPLQAHFYPVSVAMYIEDPATRFTVLMGQPLGGSSLRQGWIEVILDRRLNQDDNRGLQQGVLDNKVTPSTFALLIEKKRIVASEPDSAWNQRDSSAPGLLSLAAHTLSQAILYPVLRLIDVSESQSVAKSKLMSRFSAVEEELPCDMHIVTLRTATLESMKQDKAIYSVKNFTILMMHHWGFDCNIYTPVLGCKLSNDKVNLGKVFGKYFHNNASEVTLSGIYDYTKFPISKTVLIPPMEINSYKLYR